MRLTVNVIFSTQHLSMNWILFAEVQRLELGMVALTDGSFAARLGMGLLLVIHATFRPRLLAALG
jgi:hypothetical protein